MSDEPLFCSHCGAEDFACDCDYDKPGGLYCEVCGVIPVSREKSCHFYSQPGPSADGCHAAPSETPEK